MVVTAAFVLLFLCLLLGIGGILISGIGFAMCKTYEKATAKQAALFVRILLACFFNAGIVVASIPLSFWFTIYCVNSLHISHIALGMTVGALGIAGLMSCHIYKLKTTKKVKALLVLSKVLLYISAAILVFPAISFFAFDLPQALS